MIPSAWVAVVLALGTFRVTRLVGWDDFPPVVRVRERLLGETYRLSPTDSTSRIYSYRRPVWAHLVHCPYCLGFWLSIVVYGAWLASERVTLFALAPFALSAAVGIIARKLDP